VYFKPKWYHSHGQYCSEYFDSWFCLCRNLSCWRYYQHKYFEQYNQECQFDGCSNRNIKCYGDLCTKRNKYQYNYQCKYNNRNTEFNNWWLWSACDYHSGKQHYGHQ